MDERTLLYRQVHPSFVQQGHITSQVFTPTPKDGNRLSVYDGDLIAAEAAWRHYTAELGQRSVGVTAVTVAECAGEGLPAVADADAFPEHVLIDFSGLTRSQIRNAAKQLQEFAEARGWLYPPGGPR